MDASVLSQVKARLGALSTAGWILLAVGLLLLLALAVAGFVWWRRRKAKAAPASADGAVPRAIDAGALGKALGLSWRRFRANLPRSARRSLEDFHPVILLGTESAGKAAIIERFGGVAQRRVELGEGAGCADGPLRCQLGGDVLLLDVAEEVVRAPRERVEAGLRRALGPALRRREPVIAVCLSPEALDKLSLQQLGDLGGALRAKLDVLSELRDEPPAVRVVVSDLPGFARFDALFRLLRLPGVPAILPVDDPSDQALRAALLGYADELSAAMTQLEPRELLDLVAFLEAVPHFSNALSAVLGALFAPGGERTPRPDGLYLLAAEGGPDPLEVPAELRHPGPSPVLKHRLAALTAALIAAAGLAAAYRRDAADWARASAAVRSYELKAERERELDLRLAIRAYTSGLGAGEGLRAGFFTDGPKTVACAFVEEVRQNHLVNQLSDTLEMPPDKRRPELVLYEAALLYASRDNGLGRLVQDRLDEWAAAVHFESSLVSDYLRLAGPYRDECWIDRLRDAEQAVPSRGLEGLLPRLLGLLGKDHVFLDGEIAEVAQLARELRGERVLGVARQILSTPPLDRLAPAFKGHAARFEYLIDVEHHRAALDAVLQSVLDASVPRKARAPRSFAELVAALSPLLAPADAKAATTLVLRGTPYLIDPGAYERAVRGADAAGLLSAFLDGAPKDAVALFFPDEQSRREIRLPLDWPSGVAGASARERIYSREAFQTSVRPVAAEVRSLLDRLGDQPELRARLAESLAAALEAYADSYQKELERIFGSFRVSVSSEPGAQRVLRSLAGRRSPLRGLLQAVAADAELGLAGDASGLFDALLPIEERFGPLAAVFQAGKGGDPFTAYQDVLRNAADALGGAPPAARDGKARPRAGKASAGDEAGWVVGLSPAGRLALSVLSGAPDSPLDAVQAWAAGLALSHELAAPFQGPLRAVCAIGSRDIEKALGRWDAKLERSVGAELLSRFPFDRQAADDVDPGALAAWLHPKYGQLASQILPVLEGLVARERRRDGGWRHESAHPCAAGRDGVCVEVPRQLLDSLDRLSAAADLFWDEAGKQRPLQMTVTPRPFVADERSGPVPELVRLSAGDASVFSFNQRPKRSVIEVDWTRDQVASLSVQVKDDGGFALTSPAIVIGGTPWSFFRLLEQAERRGSTHTFRLPLGSARVLKVSYDIADPSWEALRAPGPVAWGASP